MKALFPPLIFLCLSSMAWANDFLDNSANQWQFNDQARERLDNRRNQPTLEEQIQAEPALTIGDGRNSTAAMEQKIFTQINQQNWPAVKQLLSHYLVSPRRDPSLVAYAEANLAEAQGNLPLALEKYERVLSYLPQFTRGKMDYARALFKNSEDKEAKEIFLSVMTPDLPMPVQHNINLYLDALEKRNEWRFYAALDYFKDDNINLTSDASLCLLSIGSDFCAARWSAPKALPSHGVNYTFTAEKFTPLKGRHGLMFRSLVYGADYTQDNLYNIGMANMAFGYAYRTSSHRWFLAPTFETYWQSNRRLYTAGGLMAEVRSQLTPNWQNTLTINWQDIQYVRDEEKDNNAQQYLVSLNQLYALSNKTLLFGGVDYIRRKLDFPVASFHRSGVRVGIFHTFNPWLDVTMSASRRWRKYDEYNPIFGGLRKDTEDFYSLALGLPGLQVQGIKPSLYVQHYDTESTLPLFFSYRRTQVGIRMEKSF